MQNLKNNLFNLKSKFRLVFYLLNKDNGYLLLIFNQ